MRLLKILSVLCVCALLALAQGERPTPGQRPEKPPAPQHPAPLPPSVETATTPPAAMPGFDVNALDRSVDPCVDFYKFACGAWMTKNPIPRDQSRWGRFEVLQERNRLVLRQILERVMAPDPRRSAVEQKVGDYYAACMDEKAIDALGAKPILPELDRIAAIKDRASLLAEISHVSSIGITALFNFSSHPDFHDADRMIAYLDQGGISLPDRDYYLRTDPKSVETRKKYHGHVQKMFELLGEEPAVAAQDAKTVLALETELAKASLDRVARRDPHNLDHKMTRKQLLALAPNFEFTRYFEGVAAPAFHEVNVATPGFFKEVNAQLKAVPLRDWKTYLRWRVLHGTASMLSTPFVEEHFRFYGQYLSGQRELEPRWKRCVRSTDRELGEALGQLYVDRAFGVESKQRTLHMVSSIEKAMAKDIHTLPWMTGTTKKQAQIKLQKISNNMGYPEKWRDYSKLEIVRGDAMGNFLRGNAFEQAREINKIGKPVDRKEWEMTPPTVNAYYRPSMNDINFPAGILQPPFFDNHIDDAVNYGAIGVVIGHELTHGFDDQGAKYDADGNLRNWWTAEDFREFEKHGQCFVDEYSKFVTVGDVRLNGKLTLGENTADNGGLRLSYMALQDTLAGNGVPGAPELKQQPLIDGFTPEQRFFLGYAQIWCQNITPEAARLRAITDPHSPGEYRVKGVVVNSPEFAKAFGCKAGQPMVSERPCRTW
ncbi:MAG: M13 family metallopeptidase [Terriglobales bacterium]